MSGDVQLVPSDVGRDDGGDARASRLRKLIARKRSEKERLEREITGCKAELAELGALGRRLLDPLDGEIHDHFVYVLQRRDMAAAVQDEIRQLYAELMMSGTLSARPLPGEPVADVEDHSCPFCADEEHGPGAAHDPGADREDGPGAAHHHDAGGPPPVDAPARRNDDATRSMRDLYRELASRYHPDKARDDETRAENERLMRDINSAYDAGDLDALAALSQELGFEIAGDGVLEALARQYERIKAEVRALRRDVLGQLVVDTRRCDKRGLTPPLVEMAHDIHAHADHLEELADVFRAYRTGALSREAFLSELLGDGDEPDDFAELAALVDTFVEMMAAEVVPERSRRERRGGSRARGGR